MKESGHFEELRHANDAAFERLRGEVRTLEFALRDPDPALVDHIRERVPEAPSVYRYPKNIRSRDGFQSTMSHTVAVGEVKEAINA